MNRWSFLALAASALAGTDAYAQSIDTFNPEPNAPPVTVALQADGKILIAGNFSNIGSTVRTRVARLNYDGSVDTSFGDPLVNGEVKAVAVQTDGKILIGGNFDAVSTNTRHYLARLNADGSIDTSFADPNLNSAVWGIALQPDGKVLVGGDFTYGTSPNFTQTYIARFSATGAFDSSFAPPAICCLPVRTIAVQSNGNVLVGGFFSHVGSTTHFYFAQFTGAGAFNAAFPGGSAEPEAGSIMLAPDGSIYINAIGNDQIFKYSATGTPIALSAQEATLDGEIDSFVLQPDGKLLIAGTFQNANGQGHHALARLNADGTLDSTFADLHFNFNPTDANGYIYGIAAETNGDIIAVGNFSLANGQPRQYMARVIGNDKGSSSLTAVASGGNSLVTWTRTGGGVELGAAPILQHSSDGLNYTNVGTMTRVANGWQITAPYNLAGAPFYLRAEGYASTGTSNESIGRVTSPVFVSDRLFANGFEK
jgi:uncharacterized delta-60 repeat protein